MVAEVFPEPMAVVVGVCEDDDELRGILRSALERAGMTVRSTVSGTEALAMFTERPPDVLILDIGLPDADGRDVCQALRARGVSTPVLFLTARGTVTDRVSGFSAGGDDYLVKPFSLAELLARVTALLRRRNLPDPPSLPHAGFVLEPGRHSIRQQDREAPLTPTEFRVLAALAAAPGNVVRRATLVAAAWPAGAIVHDNTLHVYIARLRRKLREIGSTAEIDTVRGVGYRLH